MKTICVKTTYMKGKEFVKKILEGERDFSRIRLEDGFDLSGYEGFQEMNDYLRKQNLASSPVYLTYSEMRLCRI